MRILIFAFGTRGDVQPFVALARDLRARGHEPVLAAPARFTGLAAAHGLEIAVVDDGPLALLDSAAAVDDAMSGGLRGKLRLAKAMPAAFRKIFDDCTGIAAARRPEMIVHNGQIIAAPHLAELHEVPVVLALTVPMYVPTREFPWPGTPLPAWLPRSVNRATYLGMKAPAAMFRSTVDRWRATLGLPRRGGRHDPLRAPGGGPTPVLNAVSAHVVAPPADWPASVATTGYWFLPAPAAELPAELTAFLAAGQPPVFVGFGSMAGTDPAATTATVLAAVRAARVRAVLATGWGGLRTGDVPDDVLVVDEVPHDLLLPHVSVAVHHGGAGTTAAAAAAGVPQVICPFVADQPFWGARMRAIGVAAAPLPQRGLSVGALAAALRTAAGRSVAARELAARIRDERGVTAAVDRLEALAAGKVGAPRSAKGPPPATQPAYTRRAGTR